MLEQDHAYRVISGYGCPSVRYSVCHQFFFHSSVVCLISGYTRPCSNTKTVALDVVRCDVAYFGLPEDALIDEENKLDKILVNRRHEAEF
jgi:hypothetical protein